MRLRRVASFKFRPMPPYSFLLTVRKPAGWHWFTPYEIWGKGTIWTGFWFRGKPIGIKARSVKNRSREVIVVDIFAQKKLGEETKPLEARLRRALNVDEDVRPLYQLMRRNKILKHLVRRLYGMREGWGSDIFSSLALAIMLQMAPIKRSEEMWDCFIKKYGARISFDKKMVLIWPNEKTVAKLSPRDIARKCRLGYRAKSLVFMAKGIVSGFPGVEDLAKLSPEEAKRKLMELYGIGEYSAAFATPHPSFSLDVWSVKIFHKLIFGKSAPQNDPRSAIEKTSAAAEKLWGDWRGYVFIYVLNDLDYLEKKFGLTAE